MGLLQNQGFGSIEPFHTVEAAAKSLRSMVGGTRIELVTPAMSTQCSTAELTAPMEGRLNTDIRAALQGLWLLSFRATCHRRDLKDVQYR